MKQVSSFLTTVSPLNLNSARNKSKQMNVAVGKTMKPSFDLVLAVNSLKGPTMLNRVMHSTVFSVLAILIVLTSNAFAEQPDQADDAASVDSTATQPNILFIFTDDHAYQSIGCYGSKINKTPNIDRIARQGIRFDRCYVTNSICGPMRAVIQTGKYSHVNGFMVNGNKFDGSQQTFPKLLQRRRLPNGGCWQMAFGNASGSAGFRLLRSAHRPRPVLQSTDA